MHGTAMTFCMAGCGKALDDWNRKRTNGDIKENGDNPMQEIAKDVLSLVAISGFLFAFSLIIHAV
ncbi:hypothetical protein J6595_05640 [Jiella sp. KSK16Y-1]|uniref:Uncharacterized protein n=1 Tax=Jiella mangrovi TaxID=2821407 RepID=A0ABS4BE90_9HYPH|nr:hypothetical protein [Jiella mangrovi]